jgi:hypothetical protein
VGPDACNDILDLDIVQITVARKVNRRKGLATQFFHAVRRVAARFQRGVYLENCVTDDSRAWAASLVAKGLLVQTPGHAYSADVQDDCPCFLCPLTDQASK